MAKEKGRQTGGQTHRSDEERMQLVQKICELYETQGATLKSCCESLGITDRTFHYWIKDSSVLSALYKKAKEGADVIYWDLIRQKAQTSLQKLIDGYETTERRTESGSNAQGRFDKESQSTSEVGPNSTAVIFALKGLYPDMFTDRQRVEHTGGIATINPNKLTAEEKRALLALTEKAS